MIIDKLHFYLPLRSGDGTIGIHDCDEPVGSRWEERPGYLCEAGLQFVVRGMDIARHLVVAIGRWGFV